MGRAEDADRQPDDGAGLIGGGLWLSRQRHAVTVQTLCATGTLILYANVFASHAYYKFFGPLSFLNLIKPESAQRRLVMKSAELLNLERGQRVLDVASGSGNAALAAARRFCDVTSTDYVPSLLEEGRGRAAASPSPSAASSTSACWPRSGGCTSSRSTSTGR